MLIKEKWETDGKCNAYSRYRGCMCLIETEASCGTYACPFYKPDGCGDWVRLENRNRVFMLAPEEAQRLICVNRERGIYVPMEVNNDVQM